MGREVERLKSLALDVQILQEFSGALTAQFDAARRVNPETSATACVFGDNVRRDLDTDHQWCAHEFSLADQAAVVLARMSATIENETGSALKTSPSPRLIVLEIFQKLLSKYASDIAQARSVAEHVQRREAYQCPSA